MCNNYIKVIVRRPSINAELFGHSHSDVAAGSWRDEELFFFDDQDPVSTSVAIRRAQAYQGRQPNGTRFAVSVWRPIAAYKVPMVGEGVAPGLRRVA